MIDRSIASRVPNRPRLEASEFIGQNIYNVSRTMRETGSHLETMRVFFLGATGYIGGEHPVRRLIL